MTFAEFQRSLAGGQPPPATLTPAILALWHDAKGDWDTAHAAAQSDPGEDGAWVHAYLHRKEGDRGNAAYWYRRAGRPTPTADARLEVEWREIAEALLTKS